MYFPPQEVARLPGHRNDVVLLYFSNAGDRLATGSKDGSVRVRTSYYMLPASSHIFEGQVAIATLMCDTVHVTSLESGLNSC